MTSSRFKRFRQLFGFTTLAVAITAWILLETLTQRGMAQQRFITPEAASTRLYQQLPNFPKENQYKPNGNQNFTPSTLVERLVQYHTMVKGRNPQFRFDWKLTLADYLGLNDPQPD
jgi:hypothetical protein